LRSAPPPGGPSDVLTTAGAGVIIEPMVEHVPQPELPVPDRAGIVPWIVALGAGIALAFALGEPLARIPDSLEREARERLDASGASAVTLEVDGRDILLGGELEVGEKAGAGAVKRREGRDALVAEIAAIEGVREVRDEFVVIDPLERASRDRSRFREALAAIDTDSLVFEPGSAELASGSGMALDALARLMRELPAFRIRVAGHTDSHGSPASNLALSRARAASVAADLAARGIDPARVVAQGYGATQPLADNATEAGRARNRRIEISYID